MLYSQHKGERVGKRSPHEICLWHGFFVKKPLMSCYGVKINKNPLSINYTELHAAMVLMFSHFNVYYNKIIVPLVIKTTDKVICICLV